jgi:hypothetical protein
MLPASQEAEKMQAAVNGVRPLAWFPSNEGSQTRNWRGKCLSAKANMTRLPCNPLLRFSKVLQSVSTIEARPAEKTLKSVEPKVLQASASRNSERSTPLTQYERQGTCPAQDPYRLHGRRGTDCLDRLQRRLEQGVLALPFVLRGCDYAQSPHDGCLTLTPARYDGTWGVT